MNETEHFVFITVSLWMSAVVVVWWRVWRDAGGEMLCERCCRYYTLRINLWQMNKRWEQMGTDELQMSNFGSHRVCFWLNLVNRGVHLWKIHWNCAVLPNGIPGRKGHQPSSLLALYVCIFSFVGYFIIPRGKFVLNDFSYRNYLCTLLSKIVWSLS